MTITDEELKALGPRLRQFQRLTGAPIIGESASAIEQSVAEIERLREALAKAAEQFEFYAQEHRQKERNQMFNGLPVLAAAASAKAETNEMFAAMCRAALPEKPS